MRSNPKFQWYWFVPVAIIAACVGAGLVSYILKPDFSLQKLVIYLSLAANLMLFVICFVLIKKHITATKHALKYEHLAYIDTMTQVKNRSAFDLAIDQLNANAYPNLTIFIADMNNLKHVNDTLGHPSGDKIICTLVHYMEMAFGNLGSIYRFGGDEFVVIIENSPIEEIYAARRNLEKLIDDHHQHGGIEISVAFGMATRQEGVNSSLHVSELLLMADVAMYQYKATQKNAMNTFQRRHEWLEQIDAATGILALPAFKSRVYDALSFGRIPFPCLVTFDLNSFDGYSDIFGWDAGNHLLQKMTSLALSLCGSKGFCAHGEGDAFWVFADHPSLDALTEKIQTETKRFQEQLGPFMLFPCFGIYCVSDSLSPVSDMCSRAISAKQKIKGRPDILWSVYSMDDHQQRASCLLTISGMQHGIDNSDVTAHFLPRYSSDGKNIVGAEACFRWRQKDGVIISSSQNSELYEKTGLILTLDWIMVTKTCQFLRRLLDAGRSTVPVSIGFSRLHAYESSPAARLASIADKHGIPHNLICIGFDESDLINDREHMAACISSIRKKDFSVSINNFTCGLTALRLLDNVSADFVRADLNSGMFAEDSQQYAQILDGMVSCCHNKNISVAASGAESAVLAEKLSVHSFDMLQGSYFGDAMSGPEFEKLMGRQ